MKSIEEMFMKKDEYAMSYLCSNCHERFTQIFKKGDRAYQGKCPNCEVLPERIIDNKFGL